MSRRKMVSNINEAAAEEPAAAVVRILDNQEVENEKPAAPEAVHFSCCTIDQVLLKACAIASLHPEDLLDWAIKKNEVTLIHHQGAKIRIQMR